jgi:hypothetical protein
VIPVPPAATAAPLRAPAALLLVLAALVFAGFPASMLFQAGGQARPLTWPEVVGCALAGVTVVLLSRWLIAPALVRTAVSMLRAAPAPSLAPALIAGLVARLISMLLMAPEPASDGAAYMALAQGLIEERRYGGPDAWAYWPPGMALALVPLLVVAPDRIALGIFAIACFVATAFGMNRLGRSLGLGGLAVWPVLLLALWPTHVLMSGLPEKELLVIALLPWILWAAREASSRWGWGFAAGLLMGAVILLQPSFQLLPFFAAGLALLVGQPWLRVLRVLVTVLLGAALVVAPWTVRNLSVLGEPVLVSTNGGGNLYRANNELATGAYVAVGKVDVEALPELEANREGKRLAMEWIREHPADFLKLSAGRVLLFPGDHSYGAYAVVRADPDRLPRPAYLALKGGTAASWLLLWLVIAAAAWHYWRSRDAVPAGSAWLLLPWLYLTGIHAIFESGSKYHLPTLATVLILAVVLLHPLVRSEHRGGA